MSYGSNNKEESPLLPLTKPSHPLPGEGGWGERDKHFIGQSSRTLRRPFLDPLLYAYDEVTVEVNAPVKFRYLKESGVGLKGLFTSLLPEVHLKSLLIYALLIVAVLMDGIRPVILVWAKGDSPKYPFMFSVWVVVVKLIVVVFSLLMWVLAKRRGETASPLNINQKFGLSLYYLVPVTAYVFSDILNFVLFEHKISPTMFACVKQSRIVITAILFRVILSRHISPIQWIAIFQLCLASILFVSDETAKDAGVVDRSEEMVGLSWLLVKCGLDSVAVIWMDKYFKDLDDKGFPYSEQQVVYALMSLIGGVIFVLIYNKDDFASGRPFFDGFNTGAWASAIITGLYGILVSLVLRYLDSMIKQFQALASIVVTTLLDQMVFGKIISLTSWVAIIVILISTFLYKLGAAQKVKSN